MYALSIAELPAYTFSMPKAFNDVIRWGFGLFLIGATSTLITTMKDISRSIDVLNTQVAVILEKVAMHERALDRQESRIENLERRFPRR